VALIVDDADWADDPSLRFLHYLAERLEDLPVALIVAARSGHPAGDSQLVARLAEMPDAHLLCPVELSVDAVRDLMTEARPTVADDDELADLCWKATGGNPFYLNELVTGICEESIGTDAGALAAAAPPAVSRRLIGRLTRLGDDAVAVAQACAVVGEVVPLATIARIATVPAAVAIDAAIRLRADHLLGDVDPPAFSHPIIRTVIRGELPPAVGANMHVMAARLLAAQGAPPEQVANHLMAGVWIDEDWALEALHAGARVAARKGAPATAVQLLRRAVSCTDDGRRSAAMLIDLGRFEAAAGEATSLSRFEAALANLDEPAEQARALHALGQTLYRYGKRAEAAITFASGVELLAGKDRDAVLALAAAQLSSTYHDASKHASALSQLRRLLTEIPGEGPLTNDERTVVGIRAAHQALTTPPAADAAHVARRALGDGAALAGEMSDGVGPRFAVVGLWLAGHAAEAHFAADKLVADARDRGDTLTFAQASSIRAQIAYTRGMVNEAGFDAEAAIAMIDLGWHGSGVLPHAVLAHTLIERDDLDAADSVLVDAESQLMPDEGMLNCLFYCARGRLRSSRGEPAAALEDFMTAGRELEPFGRNITPALAPWRSLAGLESFMLGDLDLAAILVDTELRLGEQFGLPVQVAVARRARAAISSGTRVLEDLEHAAGLLADVDAPLELARTLLRLGGVHRRAGKLVRAREPLRRSLDQAHRCGATALEREALDELHATGARPRRAVLAGPDALTPSEQRIAQLASQGYTNRQVAEALFLSQNTVAWHLRHVFRKLDVEAREGLAPRLRKNAAAPERCS
jgi:DNA-binding CsgD family transcriptional regulator